VNYLLNDVNRLGNLSPIPLTEALRRSFFFFAFLIEIYFGLCCIKWYDQNFLFGLKSFMYCVQTVQFYSRVILITLGDLNEKNNLIIMFFYPWRLTQTSLAWFWSQYGSVFFLNRTINEEFSYSTTPRFLFFSAIICSYSAWKFVSFHTLSSPRVASCNRRSFHCNRLIYSDSVVLRHYSFPTWRVFSLKFLPFIFRIWHKAEFLSLIIHWKMNLINQYGWSVCSQLSPAINIISSDSNLRKTKKGDL